jgi:hypothetical protein
MLKKNNIHPLSRDMIALYKVNRLPASTIAKRLGVSTSYVFKTLNKAGAIEKRNRGVRFDITGKRVGSLTVLRAADDYGVNGKYKWLCRCDCGNTHLVNRCNLTAANVKRCLACASQTFERNKHFKGFGHISGTWWRHLLNIAVERSLEVTVTIQELNDLLVAQDFKCSLSGLPIQFRRFRKKEVEIEQTASLDRIDSGRGYVPGNVQWVHKSINIMKLDHSVARFIELCSLVAKHSGATA